MQNLIEFCFGFNLLAEFPTTGTRGLAHTAMLPNRPMVNCTGYRGLAS